MPSAIIAAMAIIRLRPAFFADSIFGSELTKSSQECSRDALSRDAPLPGRPSREGAIDTVIRPRRTELRRFLFGIIGGTVSTAAIAALLRCELRRIDEHRHQEPISHRCSRRQRCAIANDRQT